MNICCVGFFQGYGGAEKSLINLCNGLTKLNNKVTLVCLNTADINYDLDKNVRVCFLKCHKHNKLFKIVNRYIELKKFLKNNKFDCIINFWVQPVILLSFINRKYYGTCIYSERGNPNDKEYSGLLRFMRDISFKKVDGFVFQSYKAKEMFCKKIQMRSEVIYNPVFLNNECQRNKIENVIVNVGRLHEQKNQQLLINAFALFLEKHNNFILKIFGDGELKDDLVKLCKTKNISDKVIFCGTTKKIHDEIINSKMFILTSSYEGMPNALLEAMSLGIPCITTNYEPGSANEFVDNYSNGIICKSFDADELNRNMEELITNQELYDKIERNLVDFKSRYSSKKIYRKWNNYIMERINKNGNQN